jgi:hypothetical protein
MKFCSETVLGVFHGYDGTYLLKVIIISCIDPYWPFDIKLDMFGPLFHHQHPEISLDLALMTQKG